MRVILFLVVGICSASFASAGVCSEPNGRNTFPNPGDCKSFIQCQRRQEIVQQCPHNLYYNDASGNCDYPQNMGFSDGFCEYPDEFYEKAHYCDCNKYVLCNFGVPQVFNCPTYALLNSEDFCHRC